MGHLGVEGNRVAGPEFEFFEADLDAEPPADQIGVLFPAVADQGVLWTGLRTHVVDDNQELELLVGNGCQPLPPDTVREADGLALIRREDRILDVDKRRFLFRSALAALGPWCNPLEQVVNVGSGKFDFNVDFYNAFNSDAVLTEVGSFGPVWRLPTSVIQPRFVKFAVRYDF